ncbi:pre-mRNA-splicing factor CWC25 homolog [Halichondria panicea]|uniref:pre-mRNA-splicing factor CWC25 homolog n=1 Tax=Halichondria panicea TaxID=6063 RepID=UPI00312B5925
MERGTEWLYTPLGLDKEEYLLGRKIDKHTNPSNLVPEKICRSSEGGVVDLSTKIKEDPLFMIRKSEEEKRKSVVSNPVKVSQIKQRVAKIHKNSKKRENSSPDRSRSPPSRHTRHSPPHTRHTHSHTRHSHRRQGSSSATTSRRSATSSSGRKMSREELERKRQEMMDSARVHRQTLKQGRAEIEETEGAKQAPHFLQSLRVSSLTTSNSVADRIHRSIQSVQRTKARLDSDFL